MDNKAQVSMEYLVIVALLVTITTVVAVLAVNFFSVVTGTKETGDAFIKEMTEMIE